MCVEVFRYFQSKGGWAQLPPPVATFRTRLKIENYVLLYDNAQHIIVSVLLSYLGKDGLAALNREIASMSLADQEAALGEFLGSLDELDSELDQATEIIFSEKARKEAEARFASLSADEQAQVILSSQYFWSGFIAGFFNLLAVMVHGELLTDLVAKAKDGDEESFFKSVHIDHTIASHHPFFVARIERARSEGDESFFERLAYRTRSANTKGKIRYPGVWVVFASLEALGWLDGSLTASQILDICDSAQLDRFENRIEDPSYLSKRLRDYKNRHKPLALSRQSNPN
jgi:hypothetical protein